MVAEITARKIQLQLWIENYCLSTFSRFCKPSSVEMLSSDATPSWNHLKWPCFDCRMNCDKAYCKLGNREAFSMALCCSVRCGYRERPWRMIETEGEKHEQCFLFPRSITKWGSLFLRVNSILRIHTLRAREEKNCSSFVVTAGTDASCYPSTKSHPSMQIDCPREFCQVTSANFCPRKEQEIF